MKKTAVVTGASRGIGAAIAKALAKEGYDLVLCCRKNKKLLEALSAELIEEPGILCFTKAGDVGNPAFAKELYEEAKDFFLNERFFFDGADVLVNNAGIAYYGLLSDMTVDEWNLVISTNLSSCFYMAKAFSPDMVRKKSGSIIQISSIWGSRGASCEVAYSASKGGVEAFTKALAKELAPSNVAVNAVSCGVIDTDMNRHLSEEEIKELVCEIPANRIGRPEEAARVVCSLIGASYLTGQVIGVDGGF